MEKIEFSERARTWRKGKQWERRKKAGLRILRIAEGKKGATANGKTFKGSVGVSTR
jgi:hypothetical protein